MDFTLSDDQSLLRDTAAKLLERECPPALVRAHIEQPAAYEPLWRHLSEYTALGTGPATDLCLFLEETGYVAAPGPFLATMLYASLTDDGDTPTGTVALIGDDTHPFVLEADRVDKVAIVLPGPKLAVVDRRELGLRFVPTVDFSRRLFTIEGAPVHGEPLDPAAFGAFVGNVPSPLTIGTVRLADGSSVKGFLVEPEGVAGATDISRFGGWRAYIASLSPA